MNKYRMKLSNQIIALSFLIGFLMAGCKLKLPGTETGNPDLVAMPSPVTMIPSNSKTAQLGQLICSRIHFCFPLTNVNDCETATLKNKNFGKEMNLPDIYTDLISIIEAEMTKKIIPWTTAFSECTADIKLIACDNQLMETQWNDRAAKEFPNAHWLLRASPYCQRLFD